VYCDHQGVEAAQALLTAPNTHAPCTTVPEVSCSLYNIPAVSPVYLRISATEPEEKLLPWINEQLHTWQHKQTLTRKNTQSLVIFCSFTVFF